MSSKRRRKVKSEEPKYEAPTITPRTEGQREYLTALAECSQVICYGPAGTGKSHIALTWAANQLQQGKIDTIYLTRPNVGCGPTLGLLPGTLEEKYEQWCGPALKILRDHMGKGWVASQIKNENLVYSPFEYMRGSTFNDCVVVLDEAQNASTDQMEMFITRQGQNCHTLINGDTRQSDIKSSTGLAKLIDMAEKHDIPDLAIIEFENEDIVRSDVCKAWIVAYAAE